VDVWKNEPLIDRELLSLAGIATPHIAGYSADGKANGTSMSVRAVSKFFNLGINRWFPVHVPEPENTTIEMDCAGKDDNEILHECILRTYDVLRDDQNLRSSVDTFEKQRGNYPIRREFGTYTVRLPEPIPDLERTLKRMGFNLESIY